MKKLSLLLLTVGLALPALAQTKSLLNLDKTGVAIQGYDPVAFFTDSKPVKGKPELGLYPDRCAMQLRDWLSLLFQVDRGPRAHAGRSPGHAVRSA